MQRNRLSRRSLVRAGAALLAAPLLPRNARAAATGGSASELVLPPVVVQVGDVQAQRAMLWARADRPARMRVETALDAAFRHPVAQRGPHALEVSDYTARIDVTGLPEDSEIFYRIAFDYLDGAAGSAPVSGRFRTAPIGRRDLRFVWGGDTAGQGWGINPGFGGMKIYESMRKVRPDFFIHSGDTIYADSPITPTQAAEGGRIWHNLVTPEVAKVAETLDEYRGRYRYNLLDANVRAFAAEVPQVWQWDDHEVTNNWSVGKDLSGDARYTDKHVLGHIARATRAFLDYAPMRPAAADESERIYRTLAFGELLDVFVLDMRSYRAANNANRQPEAGDETALLGREQLAWLERGLRASTALWKVIASDMPIGLVIGDGVDANGQPRFENMANGDGPPLGRELELAALLAATKRAGVRNVVWLTADVHYAAAHHYAPERARFKDFDPFWEFVAGPLNAGSFGPAQLDDTFGPKVVFHKPPPAPNTSPFAGFQFFGQVDIAAGSGVLTVQLKDIDGRTVHTEVLSPDTSRA
jgi:alkaline phosphatase D